MNADWQTDVEFHILAKFCFINKEQELGDSFIYFQVINVKIILLFILCCIKKNEVIIIKY